MSDLWLLTLAAISGLAFTMMGISYRIGQPSVRPTHILLVGGLLGAAFFAKDAMNWAWSTVPWRLYAWGIIVGPIQYLMLKLIDAGMRRGSLSSIWTAVMIGFVPAIPYAYFVFGEKTTILHLGAIVSGICCIASAALGMPRASHVNRTSGGSRFIYAAVLTGVFLCNGVTAISLKDIASSELAAVPWHRDLFLLLLYSGIVVCIGMEMLARRRFGAPPGRVLALGLMAGVGTIIGMFCITICAKGPAAAVFTISNVSSILATALFSVFFFKERISPGWFATIGLGVLTVVLAALPFEL